MTNKVLGTCIVYAFASIPASTAARSNAQGARHYLSGTKDNPSTLSNSIHGFAHHSCHNEGIIILTIGTELLAGI